MTLRDALSFVGILVLVSGVMVLFGSPQGPFLLGGIGLGLLADTAWQVLREQIAHVRP